MSRVLVTGGAGFIGAETIKQLLVQDHSVLVLDNLSSGKLSHLDLSNPNLEFLEGDILEYPLVKDLVRNTDAILHLAAIASVTASIKDPLYTMQVNTQGFVHILQAVKEVDVTIPIVYASSAAVYGDQAGKVSSEASSCYPHSPYALQKLHDEQYAALFHELYGIQSTGLRYFNAYGKGQDAQSSYAGVISRFLSAAQKQEMLTIFGDGYQARDFISIQDVASANCLALAKRHHAVVNIGTGTAHTLLDLIKILETIYERKMKVEFRDGRHGDILYSCANIIHAKEVLGFEATVDLAEGLRAMVGSFET